VIAYIGGLYVSFLLCFLRFINEKPKNDKKEEENFIVSDF